MARILIVEDDETLRTVLRQTLARQGHDVGEASNGREGLALCEAQVFEVLILDIVMPECDGLEVIRALRSRDPSVKILAVSGDGRFFATASYLRMAALLGAHQVLEKPFASDALLAAVGELLASDGDHPAVSFNWTAASRPSSRRAD